MRLNWVTTQKKLSLACDTVIAPAPMAITHITRPISLSSPICASSGSTMAAVVISATVVEPCADFSAAATINGMNSPTPLRLSVSPT